MGWFEVYIDDRYIDELIDDLNSERDHFFILLNVFLSLLRVHLVHVLFHFQMQ